MPRELWKGAIRFGLVHIPVSLYPAEDRLPHRIGRSARPHDAKEKTMRALLGIAGLAAFVTYCFYRSNPTETKAPVKDDLRRWEGEGGNDPAVATPAPVANPQSSYPAPGSDARH